MATTEHRPTTRPVDEASGWLGWISFASVMMVILGSFHLIEGFTALFNDEFFLVGDDGLVLEVDFRTWGWVHVGLGALMLAAAVSLLAGHMFGRVVGLFVAVVSAVVNLAFLAAYPVWSALMIAVDVIVIYAIVVHGREAEIY